ncbi:Serine/threonine-protein kinase pim-1 [Nibea albiflora]|uniref:Serine/threonine-protein kinase pim-1 n=1 Tax=Nibea albiflora TaxID=240163 RepID=A0ACB7F3D9_NIBAL|nr:Serine/threonine-protein kinase pim-1 [Nibea albiflora]
MSKSPPRNTSEKNVHQRVKRKVREDGEGPSKTKKRSFDIVDDGEMASSSGDTGREKKRQKKYMPQESEASSMDGQTRRGKRKASPATKKPQRKKTRTSKSPPQNTPEKNINRRGKRKVREDGEESSKPKKKKGAFNIVDDGEMASSSADTGRDRSRTFKEVERKNKRKTSSDGGKPKGRRKKSVDILETVNAQGDTFEAKYVQGKKLGKGGCGSVAIKHIPNSNVFCKHVDNNGKQISAEVAIMLKLMEGRTGVGSSVAVSLLDWYDLGQELILVMERPVPSTDLLKYVQGNGGSIEEKVAKIIVKQLVDAAKELEDKRIFHRDIKVENILIETSSRTPRLRLIDFGLSCFVKESSRYHIFYGTPDHIPPEWYSSNTYHAGSTTVWQVGVVLYESVHRKNNFVTKKFTRNRQRISNKLSKKCQDFLKDCLAKNPEDRPSLEQLQQHPWLR